MNAKKVIFWLVVLFIGWFILTNPHGAAAATTNLLNALKGVGNSLSVFFTSL